MTSALETRVERVWLRCLKRKRDGRCEFVSGVGPHLQRRGWVGDGDHRADFMTPPVGVALDRRGAERGLWLDVEVPTDRQTLELAATLHEKRAPANSHHDELLLWARYWPRDSVAYRTSGREAFDARPAAPTREVRRERAEAIVSLMGSLWVRRVAWLDGDERPPRLLDPEVPAGLDPRVVAVATGEGFPEGDEIERVHIERERNAALVDEAKRRAFERDGRLACVVCGFDFETVYGSVGAGFIEAHHTQPLSALQGERLTRVADLALVCANCHRMLHRRRPWLTMEQLANGIASVRTDGAGRAMAD